MDETLIQSRRNKWIKRVRKAIDRHEEEIVVEGPKMIGDAIARGWKPTVILEEQTGAKKREGSLIVEPALFREISTTKTSQGLVALFPRPDASFDDLSRPGPRRVVALDTVQDPGNVGTIIRISAAFGATGVVRLSGTADPWSSKAIRASAGSIMTLPVIECSRDDLIRYALDQRLSIYAADPGASATTIPPSSDIVLVLGSEGQGLSERWRPIAHGVRIPTSERVESINVAAAAAILLSDLYSAG